MKLVCLIQALTCLILGVTLLVMTSQQSQMAYALQAKAIERQDKIMEALLKVRGSYYTSCPKIVHIWTGSDMPKKYVEQLMNAKYDYILLGQDDWDYYAKKFALEHQRDFEEESALFRGSTKSDILRWLYLYYNAGVYFDIDYDFTDKCLDFVSEIYRSDFDVMAGEQQDGAVFKKPNDPSYTYEHTSNYMETNPIFVKSRYSEKLLRILKTANFASIVHEMYDQELTLIKVREYCPHRYDGTWKR